MYEYQQTCRNKLKLFTNEARELYQIMNLKCMTGSSLDFIILGILLLSLAYSKYEVADVH
jgi:hypothetical protein